jgi:hypothetical protein
MLRSDALGIRWFGALLITGVVCSSCGLHEQALTIQYFLDTLRVESHGTTYLILRASPKDSTQRNKLKE